MPEYTFLLYSINNQLLKVVEGIIYSSSRHFPSWEWVVVR